MLFLKMLPTLLLACSIVIPIKVSEVKISTKVETQKTNRVWLGIICPLVVFSLAITYCGLTLQNAVYSSTISLVNLVPLGLCGLQYARRKYWNQKEN